MEKTFNQVREGDRFEVVRPTAGLMPGMQGVVTMKCRDGLTNRLLVRVLVAGLNHEPFVSWPSSDLDFEEDEREPRVLGKYIMDRLAGKAAAE